MLIQKLTIFASIFLSKTKRIIRNMKNIRKKMNTIHFQQAIVKNLSAVYRVSTKFSTFSTQLNEHCMFKHKIQQPVEIERAFTERSE